MGVEPTSLTGHDFKSCAYTYSATGPILSPFVKTSAGRWILQPTNSWAKSAEAWAGIEPAHVGFADRSVTTSPPRQTRIYIITIEKTLLFCNTLTSLAPIAQLVEQTPLKRKVVGSIPTGGTLGGW